MLPSKVGLFGSSNKDNPLRSDLVNQRLELIFAHSWSDIVGIAVMVQALLGQGKWKSNILQLCCKLPACIFVISHSCMKRAMFSAQWCNSTIIILTKALVSVDAPGNKLILLLYIWLITGNLSPLPSQLKADAEKL